MRLIPDYHLEFTFGYQIRFRSVPSGIENVQNYRVVLVFLKRARIWLRVENYDPVPTLFIREWGSWMLLIPTRRSDDHFYKI